MYYNPAVDLDTLLTTVAFVFFDDYVSDSICLLSNSRVSPIYIGVNIINKSWK